MFDNTFFDGKYNILPNEFFAQEENEYYVYYYSLYCPPCNDLKSNMENYIEKSKIKVYTLSLQNFGENDDKLFKEKNTNLTNDEMASEMIGKSKLNDVYLVGTPSLYLITTNSDNIKTIKEVILGYAKITSYILK